MENSTITERMRGDLNEARRNQDRIRVLVLGTTLSDLHNYKIELGRALSEQDEITVLSRALKRREEAAEQYRQGGRIDVAEREETEAAIIRSYLPRELDEAEVRALIADAIAGGAIRMGDVMKVVVPKTKGRFDGRRLGEMVKEMLAS